MLTEGIFNGAEFLGDADFTKSGFDAFSLLLKTNRGGITADFRDTRFMQKATFAGAQFGGGTTFEKAIFAHGVPIEVEPFLLGASINKASNGQDGEM